MGDVGRTIFGIVAFVGGAILTALGQPQWGLPLMAAGFQVLRGPVGLDQRKRGIEQNIVSPTARLPVVYGRGKVGLRIVDIRVWGAEHKKLTIVGALCHGASLADTGIQDLREIYFDGKLAFDASGVIQDDFKKDGAARAFLSFQDGEHTQAVDGNLTTNFPGVWTTSHRGKGVAYVVITLYFSPKIFPGVPDITCVVDGTKVMTTGNAHAHSTNPAYCIRDYLLNPVYGFGLGRRSPAASGWATQSGLGGFSATALVSGSYEGSAFNTNAAVPGAWVKWDFQVPREFDSVDLQPQFGLSQAGQWTVEYSDDNAAWTAVTGVTVKGIYLRPHNRYWWASVGAHRYWRLLLANTPGSSADVACIDWYETELDWASFATVAALCDTTITVPPAASAYKAVAAVTSVSPITLTVTGHGWATNDKVNLALTDGSTQSGLGIGGFDIAGETYTITKIDNDNFHLGVSGAGSYGAGTLRAGKLVAIKRFEMNGVVDTERERADCLQEMLTSCRGTLVWQGGKYRLFVRVDGAAVMTLTEDDFIGDIRFSIPGNETRWNSVEIMHPDGDAPLHAYSTNVVNYPAPNTQNTYLIDDNYFESRGALSLPFTVNKYAATAIGVALLREARNGFMCEFVGKGRLLGLQVGDIVNITHSTPGWTDKPFVIMALTLLEDGTVAGSAVEHEATAYNDDDTLLQLEAPNTSLPSALTDPAAPTSLVLSATFGDVIADSSGRYIQRIKVEWTASVDPFVARYEVWGKRSTDATFVLLAETDEDGTLAYISPVSIGETWDVEVYAVTVLGRVSAALSGSVAISTYSTPEGLVEFFEAALSGRWSESGAGSSALRDCADSVNGGKCLGILGARTFQWTGQGAGGIPFDRNKLYLIRARVRALNPGGGHFSLGFRCSGTPVYIGHGGFWNDSIMYVAAYQETIAAGLTWVEFIGYLRGWNGDWFTPAAGLLANSGFNSFSAAACGDGLVTATAFGSDTAVAGSTITVDFGVGVTKKIVGIRLYLLAGSGVAQYKFQYSDNGSVWNDCDFGSSNVPSSATTWTPSAAGWSTKHLATGGGSTPMTAHRYYRLYLNNTPGAGPEVAELQLLEAPASPDPLVQAPSPLSPAAAPAGTLYITPYFASTLTDAEVDFVEMPRQVMSTSLS